MSKTINPFKMFVGCIVPNWLLESDIVSLGAKLCYGRLCQYSGRNGRCFPSRNELARALGCVRETAWRYVKELEDAKLIEQIDNEYVFFHHPLMDDVADSQHDVAGLQHDVADSQPPIVLRESIKESLTPASLETSFPKQRFNKTKKLEYTPAFESWWKLYPTRNGIKVGKPDAFKKFLKITDLDSLTTATKAYAASKEVKEGYAKDAVRFLKEGVWEAWRGQRIDSKPIVDGFDRYKNQRPEDLA